jgi:2-aminoadipate transaminase
MSELLRPGRGGQAALQYGTTAGLPLLRRLTAKGLRDLDGAGAGDPAYSPERMVITHGSQQLLYMLTEALCDPGDIILVEDPTYFVLLGIVQSHGLKARGIRLQSDGLDLAHLETVLQRLQRTGELRRVKLLYMVSYFQNPTGTTTAFAKKAGALALLRHYERAAGHPIYLLEDTAYRELGFDATGMKSALAVRRHGERVVCTGTYSKPFATGIRVGFGLLPEPLLSAVLRIKGNHDFGTASLLQHLLVRAIVSGRYEAHLGMLRARYRRKAQAMLKVMEEHFPSAVEWQEPEGGLYVWARLPSRVKSGSESKLFREALARDVLYVPGKFCYAEDPTRRRPDNEMRLSFGAATEANIRAGIARLGAAIHQFLD